MQTRPSIVVPANKWLERIARVALPLVLVGAAMVSMTSAPAMAQSSEASGSRDDANGANGTNGSGLDSALEQQVRQLALEGGRTVAANGEAPPRIEVVVGQLDSRLRLAPCQRIEPYLPEGTRPWGKSRIGLRCAQGSVKWNVYLPITVKVWGRGLVAAHAISANSVLTATDVAQADVDLAEDSSAPLTDDQFVIGRAVTRSLKPGQSLRTSHLKARQYFVAGEVVTVLAQGPGFSVSSEAVALSNGIEGQLARVRTESGRVLTGQPVAERRVELGM